MATIDPIRARILCSRPDKGVSIIVPSVRCVAVLETGWCAKRNRPYVPEERRAFEVEKLMHSPEWRRDASDEARFDLAERWIYGLCHGGFAADDAVRLIGEYSKHPDHFALEVVDVDDLPTNRTYREAWRRSHNGGPIWIDWDAVTRIEERLAWQVYEARA